ncbi:hypothetical protein KDA11_04110 [Candidatus Saccharibacteria bacterium]|nr:hypothetical protein [Candidatus Saccharibacteria bacterium]
MQRLYKLHTDGLISRNELNVALSSELDATTEHSIGYEAEVLTSAQYDLGKFSVIQAFDNDYLSRTRQVSVDVEPYGYDVAPEGLYELQSPVYNSPDALTISALGIARKGWLPKIPTRGLITSHVSIGTNQALHPQDIKDMTPALRAVEICNGTTANRLLSPFKIAPHSGLRPKYEQGVSWDCKGFAGIKIEEFTDTHNLLNNKLYTTKNRMEFRTLGYYSIGQFHTTLERLYFFSRALVGGQSDAREHFDTYSRWTINFFKQRGLPIEPTEDEYKYSNYFRQYADFIASKTNVDELIDRTNQAIDQLRRVFNMPSRLKDKL